MVDHHAIAATVTRPGRSSIEATFLPKAIGIGYTRWRWQALTSAGAFPQSAQLLRLHIPRLVGCVPSGAPYVTRGPTSGRMITLTFDDGPWYDTPQFLDVLEREHVAATFFQIGEQISRYGSVDRRILRDGDMIGDHTWNHATVSGGGSFAAGEISQTAAAIRGATGGFSPCLFRAPGGAVSSALISEARSMGFTTIEWDVDPRDWATPGTGAIYSNVIANAQPGAIVLQHDGGGNRSETLAALPHEIDTLRREGYHFVTITQMLGYRLLYK
jgi:peptidoglycan/xylan/chitin deacetylase (PgdA/CDA1 family)